MINVVYMGTPDIAVNCLEKLHSSEDINIAAVVTQPDRPAGRGNKLTPPPVKVTAEALGIPVFQTEAIKNDEELKAQLKKIAPDFFVTFSFGQIISQDVLDIPKFATVNLHVSLLPKYRGANPIQRAIYNGDKETGITTMITVLALDAGDICMQEKIAIPQDMTDKELFEEIREKAPNLMQKTLIGLYNKTLTPVAQDDSQKTIAKKFKKEDAVIDWSKTAEQIHNQVRSMTTWPVACTSYNQKAVKILSTSIIDIEKEHKTTGEVLEVRKDGIVVSTAKGSLLIKELKPEGKPKMEAYAWTNGVKLKAGERFE